jgi:hypothetical protein
MAEEREKERHEALCGILKETEDALMKSQTTPSREYSVEEKETWAFRRKVGDLIDLVRTLKKVSRCEVT